VTRPISHGFQKAAVQNGPASGKPRHHHAHNCLIVGILNRSHRRQGELRAVGGEPNQRIRPVKLHLELRGPPRLPKHRGTRTRAFVTPVRNLLPRTNRCGVSSPLKPVGRRQLKGIVTLPSHIICALRHSRSAAASGYVCRHSVSGHRWRFAVDVGANGSRTGTSWAPTVTRRLNGGRSRIPSCPAASSTRHGIAKNRHCRGNSQRAQASARRCELAAARSPAPVKRW